MSVQSCRLMSTAGRVSLSSTASPPTEIINAVERPDKVKMGPINLSIGFNVTLQLVCNGVWLEPHTIYNFYIGAYPLQVNMLDGA